MPEKISKAETLIIGAGCAGLYLGTLVPALILESGAVPGRKLAASGGGRCNFTNRRISPASYLCQPDPFFCQPALERFGFEKALALMRGLALPFEERGHGPFFLKCPARKLVERLIKGCAAKGSTICLEEGALSARAAGGLFRVETVRRAIACRNLVLAQGGPSWPSLAQNRDPWRLAHDLGLRLIPARPGLVPFRHCGGSPLKTLAGVSARVVISLPGQEYLGRMPLFGDEILFTHKGLSGPAALRASLFFRGGPLELDFAPGRDFEAMLDESPKATPRSLAATFLPRRLVDALLPPDLARIKNARISRRDRKILAGRLHGFRLEGLTSSGMARAEVCSGGVSTEEIDSQSMESKNIPRLYILGEMLAVTGELGGYNIHWALASAAAAARALK